MAGQTKNQQLLERRIEDFRKKYIYAGELLDYLKRDQVKVVRVEAGKQGRWALFCVLPENTGQMFDIEREVLFLVANYDRLEPRILSELQRQLRENARVDDQLAVLVTADDSAERLARQRVGETAILTLDARQLPDGLPVLRSALSTLLSSVDHFNVTTPLTSPQAFFGREKDIASVRQCLDAGQHVGIFGLRKAGKSSLLNRIAALQKDRGWALGQLDLNEYFGTPGRLRADIVSSLAKDSARLGVKAGRLASIHSPRGDTIRQHWLRDLGSVMDALAARNVPGVALVIDEIDTALPGRTLAVSEEEDELGLFRALSQLRAFVQGRQARGQMSPVLLSAGVNPTIFEDPKIRGLANPLYQFALLKFIEPLDREALQAMIRALGKRTGMRFREHTLIDALFAEYGGHPLLTRQACSYIHKQRPPGIVPYRVTDVDVTRAITATGPGTPLDHALDIPMSFEEWYPEEAATLEQRLTAAAAGTQIAGTEGIEHAIAYGLLRDDGTVRMRALTRGARQYPSHVV